MSERDGTRPGHRSGRGPWASPPESLPHIFERFYRTDQSRARQTGGTGLGLAIAKWIVDRHGGWFEVVSREDVGTRITFVLPLEGTA